MIYAKISNGQLIISPEIIKEGETLILNPQHSKLLELGYKPVRFIEPPLPQDGYFFSSFFEQTENEIYQVWEEHLLPEPELTDGEYLLEKLGL